MDIDRDGEQGPRADEAASGEGLVGGTPPGMDRKDVVGRSELARRLQPSVFPATRKQLLESAEETNAPDVIRSLLARLPEDQSYENVQDVWRALGGGTEDVEHRP